MNKLQSWFWKRWRMAERATIALCRPTAEKIGPIDWREMTIALKTDWKALRAGDGERPLKRVQTRDPPLPHFSRIFGHDSSAWPRNTCPVCGWRTYANGDWRPAAGKPRWNKEWHAPCYAAYTVWCDPTWMAYGIAERQNGRCPITGQPILLSATGTLYGDVEVDHITPLWRVRYEAEKHSWPDVLRFWGPRNLQVLSGEGHLIKTSQEATERASFHSRAAASGMLALGPV